MVWSESSAGAKKMNERTRRANVQWTFERENRKAGGKAKNLQDNRILQDKISTLINI